MQGETASAGLKATGEYPEDLAKMINYGGYTKQLVTHSSIFARKILWTEEPSGQQSMGLQRVRHD